MSPAPGRWHAWWIAARPRTLPLAAAPVAVGTALAIADGSWAPAIAIAALVGALLLQIGANLANDAFDHLRGADGPARLGPTRAAASGLISPRALLSATAGVFAAAAAAGVYLAQAAGWPVIAIGAGGIVAAVGYVGPGAYGYRGLGDLAVFVFFGLVAVVGTYWVLAGSVRPDAWLAAVPVGALATAVLVVNNLRDRTEDERSGKRTLAVTLGANGARAEYALLVALAFATIFVLGFRRGPALLLPILLAPWALILTRRVFSLDGAALNPVLAATAALAGAFSLLLAAGFLL